MSERFSGLLRLTYPIRCAKIYHKIKTAKHITEGREDFIMLKQLSIYAENKKGVMQNITGILKDEDINILGSVTNDSAEYGIVRMVVSDPDKAKEALIAAGYLCHVIDVIGVEVEDKTGNLNDLLLTLKDSNVSVDYLYLSFNRDSGKPIMVFHTEDIMEVRACLKSRGYTVL